MKVTMLNYFNGFKCIASDCKNSCCEKWQIDIDKKSLKHYIKIKNKKPKNCSKEFIEKLETGIDQNNSTFVIENGRCVFLDDKKLCEIYKNLGENALCQVCTDHPRYRNFFSNKIEMGFSIACEVSCKKVVLFKEKAEEITVKKGISLKKKTKLETQILDFRKTIIDILQNRSIDFTNKFEKIFLLSKVDVEKLFKIDIKNVLLSLEILSDNWRQLALQIFDLKSSIKYIEKFSVNFEQLGVYFIYKHLPNSFDNLDIFSRTAFCMLCLLIIANIAEKQQKNDINTLISVAREFSEEIEYNDENVNTLLDKIDDVLIK